LYRFAFRPRWIVRHVIVAVVVGLFALAGVWQIHRLHERRARNALITTRSHMPEAPLGPGLSDPVTAPHRRVRVEGRYDAAREVVLLGRPNGDRPGNHVLTPLVAGNGRAVVVDRGWVPQGFDSPPVAQAAAPDGHVVVHGELLASERSPFRSTNVRTKVVALIDLRRLGSQLPYPVDSFYVVLRSQEPPQSGQLPIPVPLGALDDGPHLSYAIQWFSFIAIALIGYGAFLRREARRGVHRLSSAE
jgi:cytochrome oxidase assembly protein ShyY1